MGVTFDPYQPNYGLVEMSSEEEIARRLVGKTLPALRAFLAELSAMQQEWYVNGIPAKIDAAEAAEQTLAGHSAETWRDWGETFIALQTFLSTPIATIGKTPAQVLIKRYAAQEVQA